MYRYTTPTIPCSLQDVAFEQVELVRIAISGKNSLIVREIPATDFDNTGTASVELTQEETAGLGTDNDTVQIQARIKYKDGTVQATNKVRCALLDVLDKVVI